MVPFFLPDGVYILGVIGVYCTFTFLSYYVCFFCAHTRQNGPMWQYKTELVIRICPLKSPPYLPQSCPAFPLLCFPESRQDTLYVSIGHRRCDNEIYRDPSQARKALFTAYELDWTVLRTDRNKLTQLHDAFAGHARQRAKYTLHLRKYRLPAATGVQNIGNQ